MTPFITFVFGPFPSQKKILPPKWPTLRIRKGPPCNGGVSLNLCFWVLKTATLEGEIGILRVWWNNSTYCGEIAPQWNRFFFPPCIGVTHFTPFITIGKRGPSCTQHLVDGLILSHRILPPKMTQQFLGDFRRLEVSKAIRSAGKSDLAGDPSLWRNLHQLNDDFGSS